MPNFAGFFLTPVINSVRASVKPFNGQCTWAFSQIKDPVASIIGKDQISKDGICEMLSAKWIETHANESHLSTWLEGAGHAIDPSKIRQLMQLFIIGSSMNRSAIIGNAVKGGDVDQTQATINWLRAKGIIQRKSIKPIQFLGGASENIANTSTASRAGGGDRHDFAQQMANAIAFSMKNGTGSYRTIGIWGSGGGHAMAAWVGQDVAFFDPNYGEFWFERRQDFINWWPTFFKKSMYSMKKVGLCRKYEIMDYAKKAF